MHYYTAFGFSIASELECPELVELTKIQDEIDLHIKVGETPKVLEHGISITRNMTANASEVLFDFESVGRYHIVNGTHVTITPAPSVLPQTLRLYLFGSAMGAILHQRKFLPMHASSICADDKAILFSGRSQAGKSTTAHTLLQRGYILQTDDICVIRNINGKAMVYSAFPQMKMWDHTLESKGITKDGLEPIIHRMNKFNMPIAEQFNSTPIELERIYILSPAETATIELTDLQGIEKFRAILRNVYRRRFIRALNSTDQLFKDLSTFLQPVSVTRITRPNHMNTMDEIGDLVEQQISNFYTMNAIK